MSNPDVAMTLDDCVGEVLGMLTGLELTYDPQQDRYRNIVRQINRALRANALEREWSYYSSVETVGTAQQGQQTVDIRATRRPRIVGDDAVRLVDASGRTVRWAFFLPRDALSKYVGRRGLWASITRQAITFSRPFNEAEHGLEIRIPVMREPRMFRLPESPADVNAEIPEVPAEIREQLLDFEYPDAVLMRAAFFYAQTDPVMQPRVQTLEAEYKNFFYALNERDDRNTDAPFQNDYAVPIQGSINDTSSWDVLHPHSDERY